MTSAFASLDFTLQITTFVSYFKDELPIFTRVRSDNKLNNTLSCRFRVAYVYLCDMGLNVRLGGVIKDMLPCTLYPDTGNIDSSLVTTIFYYQTCVEPYFIYVIHHN